jgi:hypothetical protein
MSQCYFCFFRLQGTTNHNLLRKLVLMSFTTMFENMMIKMMKKIAKDYNIDLDEMKEKYLGIPSEPDEEEVPVVKKKKPGVRTKASVLAEKEKEILPLSKMKKADLINRCRELSLDESGTVADLKARIKNHNKFVKTRLAQKTPTPQEPEPELEKPKKRSLPKSFGKILAPIDKAWVKLMSGKEGTMVCVIRDDKYIDVDQEDGVCIASIITTDEITDAHGDPKIIQVAREPVAEDKGAEAIFEELKKMEFKSINVTCSDVEYTF